MIKMRIMVPVLISILGLFLLMGAAVADDTTADDWVTNEGNTNNETR